MPPKRAREPSAGTNPPDDAAAASGPIVLRRTRSNSNASNTSDVRDDDGDGAPRPKRSRVDRGAGRLSEASDASMGEEEEEKDGGRGANGPRRAPLAKRATARRKSTAVADGGGMDKRSTTDAANQQAAAKRGRKSTGGIVTAPASGSQAATAATALTTVPPTPQQPMAIANGRHTPATQPQLTNGGGGIVGNGRPPLPASSAARGQGRRSIGAAATTVVAVGAGGGGGGGGDEEGSVLRGRRSNARTGGDGQVKLPGTGGGAKQRQAASLQGSPAHGVSPSRIRRITGSAESPEDAGSGDGGDGLPLRAGPERGGALGKVGAAALGRVKAWTMVLGRRLPDIETGMVLPKLRNACLRCLLLLVMLVGARAVWEVTLMAIGSRMSGDGGGIAGVGDGGGGGGGESRREAALSLVRENEAFRSLEGVLADRRRHLSEIEAQDKKAQEKLDNLRGVVSSLDGQMDLLRAQVVEGAASRGSPDDPKVLEALALSQLAELVEMEEAVKALVEATRDTIDQGQEWSEAAMRDVEGLAQAGGGRDGAVDVEGEAERVAQEAYQAEFVGSLHGVFRDLERLDLARVDVESAVPEKLPHEDIERLLERVEDARLSCGDLTKRVETFVAEEVWTKLHDNDDDEGGDGIDMPLPLQTLYTLEEVKELVATEVEIFSYGGTGMRDYASLLSGASVAYGPLVTEDGRQGQLTTPTLAHSALPWADYVLHWLRVPGRVYADDGDAALSLSNSLGSCFAFRGGEGRLTVKLARPPPSEKIRDHGSSSSVAEDGRGSSGAASSSAVSGFVKVTHVSIEHARTAAAPTAVKSAPRAFRVTGWDADPTAHAWAAPAVEAGDESSSSTATTTLKPYVLVEGAEFLAGGDDIGAPGVQTFAVSERSRESAPPVGWVTLEVESNHGGKWTCLYGFRVHGDPVA